MMNSMGLNILSHLSGGLNKKENSSVFISPFSISNALGMVCLGTQEGGTAHTELVTAWGHKRDYSGLGKLGADQVPVLESDMLAFLRFLLNVEQTDMHCGNSVWCKDGCNAEYMREALAQLNAEAGELLDDEAQACLRINQWCEAATQGQVSSIIHKMAPNTIAILVNAVYFKGSWETPFEQGALGYFEPAGKEKKKCVMMRREDEHMLYTEHAGVQMVELPYHGGQFAAVIMLPRKGEGALAKLIKQLVEEDLMETLRKAQAPKHVTLLLPRFSLEFATDLIAALELLGIKQAFDPSAHYEFTRMSQRPDVFISSVFHKAKVEVDEKGTKAAAATVVKAVNRCAGPPPPPEVIFGWPFLFGIKNREGALMFVGTVEDVAEYEGSEGFDEEYQGSEGSESP